MTRRRWRGYTDLGTVRVPPLPAGFVMVDRVTATEYLLSHTSSNNTVLLTTPVPGQWRGIAINAFSGPLLDSPIGLLRLYISSGTLTFELAPDAFKGVNHPPVTTRNFGESGIVYEITASAVAALGDALTVTRILG